MKITLKNDMSIEMKKSFEEFCQQNYIKTNPFDMTYYDDTYTDFQVFTICKNAFEVGYKYAHEEIEKALLGGE